MLTAYLISAFLLGAMGSAHCLGMCGGIITALSVASNNKNKWLKTIAYQVGRISSYTFLGLIVGLIGLNIDSFITFPVLPLLSGVLLIMMGFYLSRWWMGLIYLEKAGSILWKRLSIFSTKLLPVTSTSNAFFLGMLWGWLPCGLVYTALSYALSTAQPMHSALFMLLFGLGTLPATLTAGAASTQLKTALRNKLFRNICSLLIIALGLYILGDTFLRSKNTYNHSHHSSLTTKL